MFLFLSPAQASLLYDFSRKWFTLGSAILCPVTFVINAPFGRFALSGESIFILDGRKSWMVMEIVSPLMFIWSFISSPLSNGEFVSLVPAPAQYVLAGAYLMHYANRALISPLRTPSRSKAHIVVTLFGVTFNLFNGSLMGTYLSSPAAHAYLGSEDTLSRPSFYLGLALWLIGFLGNIVHDEILLNIRRRAKDKKNEDGSSADSSGKKKTTTEHYAIPYGLLYRYISFPNYFCEWVEWFGFALAASPLPITAASFSTSNLKSLFMTDAVSALLRAPPSAFTPVLTPPWIFLLNEIVLMLPRAYNGHQWYKAKFGSTYPKERRVVVPFVL